MMRWRTMRRIERLASFRLVFVDHRQGPSSREKETVAFIGSEVLRPVVNFTG